MMEYLDKLIEAVEKGDSKFISRREHENIGVGGANAGTIRASFWGGLDAAMALHDEILPDHLWAITPMGKVRILDKSFNDISESGYSGSVARAWLLAILKAHRHNLANGAAQ